MHLKAMLPAFTAAMLSLAGCQTYNASATKDAIIIDVRTQNEYDAGHLEGALHMPFDKIGALLPPKIAGKGTRILLYCRSGNRSGKALKTIQALGYTNAKNIGAMPDAAKATGKKIVK